MTVRKQMVFLTSNADDVIYGTSDAEHIVGGRGNDLLIGDPTSTGPGGNDDIDGGDGDDEVIGGAGDDILRGGNGADYLQGDAGNDVIYLEGDYFGDTNAQGNNASVRGGSDNDRFVLDQSNAGSVFENFIWDFETGTSGSPVDRIDLSLIANAKSFADLDISSGNMNIGDGKPVTEIYVKGDALGRVVTLYNVTPAQLRAENFIFSGLSTPADLGSISGTTANDTLSGTAGANTISGLGGADTMTGRTGDDTYLVDNVGDKVNELPGGGYDTVQSSVSYTLSDNVEQLVLTGNAAINATGNIENNRLVGNVADNILDGGAGIDQMVGGAGNDAYIVDNQGDRVVELVGAGIDLVKASVSTTLSANVENLTLTGSSNINATGNELDNILVGNGGSNVLDGSLGADQMTGGLGDDTYYVDNTADAVVEAADAGQDTVVAAINFTLGSNIESLSLVGTAVTGTGNALDNTLTGNSLNNSLVGGTGNDVLDGGIGADTMDGGAGDDIYFVDDIGDVVTENAGEGNDTVLSKVSFDLSSMPNVENVVLTGIANLNAIGNTSDNQLIGNSGANALTGGAGNDILDGGAGKTCSLGAWAATHTYLALDTAKTPSWT
jgi:Ca2+-binding RTX toxin-like protein